VHDIVELEKRGLVAVYVASDAFQEAGRLQARALGYDPAAVFVPHPIQDRTDEEMRNLAANALEDIIKAVQPE
jgi:hypothetical protein